MKKEKITVLALHLGYGGIEQYISSLCKMLHNEYQIEIISTYKVLEKPAFEIPSNVNITYLIDDKPNRKELVEALKKGHYMQAIKESFESLSLLYKKRKYNIKAIKKIDSKYIITTRYFHNKLVGTYAKKEAIKIATEHNFHNNNSKYIKKIIESVEKVDYFVLVSEVLKDFYENKVKAKCFYIPNVIDKLPTKTSTSNSHNIISVGRLSKEKGQEDLLDIVKLLKEKYSDVKLYLVGDGIEKNNIINYINTNSLNKNVVLTGFLSKNDIELKMLDSSVFVTTSYTESFGLVVIEACSYKLPVVAFDTATGIKKILENGNGVLIENRDKEKMKNAIIKIFEDEDYKKQIANKGYKNCQKYLASNVKKDWINLLKQR